MNEQDEPSSNDDTGKPDELFEFLEFSSDDSAPTSQELALWLSEFMGKEKQARQMYQRNFLSLIVDKTWSEFGVEGMCELMVAIDRRAGWISDIIIEDADLHDQLFNAYGIYDDDAIYKARMCEQTTELNKKIWRLRKKYAKLIADEIVEKTSSTSTETDTGN